MFRKKPSKYYQGENPKGMKIATACLLIFFFIIIWIGFSHEHGGIVSKILTP